MSEILDIAAVVERLLKVDNILILCHKNPDGDTIGSAGALFWALKALGKNVMVLCSDEIPARYNYMNIAVFDDSYSPEYIVAVDVAGMQLFGDVTVSWAENCHLCIDHHPSNSRYADAMLLDGNAAATAEVMYDLLVAMGVQITPIIANCLYTGIATDTGCFKFANVTPRTHTTTAKLMEAGAEYVMLNELLFESKSRRRLAIERIALESLEYHFDDTCALVVLTKEQIAETGADGTDLEGITSMPRTIEGVKVGITMRQQPTGSYKVSVRTSTGVNACAICARLGGGGHHRASGCEIIGGLQNAKAALLTEVERELKNPTPIEEQE
ncbi:MAG: bifunctional oligoribonuclease/PAP phosphatase NrnA [Oscillospiraceae bacterium]|nr:bifunctional oligoribonuclease/PAP phosphatase NrnA [Oscillospiraceae bacterium]